jgi:hypothetical protein
MGKGDIKSPRVWNIAPDAANDVVARRGTDRPAEELLIPAMRRNPPKGSQRYEITPSALREVSPQRSPRRTWQVWRKDGWKELDVTARARIETQEHRGNTLFQVEEEGRNVWIDTEQLVAKDPLTGTQRSLRVLDEDDLNVTCPDLRHMRPAPLTRSISITVHRPPVFQVYRGGEWHPLTEDVADAVTSKVAQGEAVFDVNVAGATHRFDLNTMHEINVKSGAKWRLRRLDPLKITAPTSPTLRSPQSRRAMPFFEGFMAKTRRAFREFDRLGKGRISDKELEAGLTEKLRANSSLDRFTTKLLEETVKHVSKTIRLGTGSITQSEWTHYHLLQDSSANAASNRVLNEKLGKEIKREREVLDRLLKMFERADVRKKKELTKAEMVAACEQAVKEAKTGSLEATGAKKFLEEMKGNEPSEDVGVSYYDFCMVMLGRRKEPVELYCYDLAGGKAPLLTPLVGQYWEGVWHTSIVVFGKEYWYGGRLFESVPQTTAFGKPTRIEALGSTLRTKDELWELLTRELAREFTTANYDVLTHNCNHFSDELSRFLLNEPIPQHIASQGEAVLSSPLSRLFRPMMNFYLGRFESGGSDTRSTDDSRAEAEWDTVAIGSIVLLTQHDGATPVIAEVLDRAHGLCDVRWIDLELGEIVEGHAVTKAQVKPLIGVNTGRKAATPLPGVPPLRQPSVLTCGLFCPVG